MVIRSVAVSASLQNFKNFPYKKFELRTVVKYLTPVPLLIKEKALVKGVTHRFEVLHGGTYLEITVLYGGT